MTMVVGPMTMAEGVYGHRALLRKHEQDDELLYSPFSCGDMQGITVPITCPMIAQPFSTVGSRHSGENKKRKELFLMMSSREARRPACARRALRRDWRNSHQCDSPMPTGLSSPAPRPSAATTLQHTVHVSKASPGAAQLQAQVTSTGELSWGISGGGLGRSEEM